PGVRCWNVPESLSWYLASIVTFWSSESLPACTAASAAIMMEILRVLAEGTGTPPKRSARAPVARSFKYQLVWKGSASHSSLNFCTSSRIGLGSLGSAAIEPDVPEMHVGAGLVAGHVLAASVEAEVVADLDAGGVGVEERLHLLDERVALLEVRLAPHRLQQRVLLGIAPPARPFAEDLRGRGRLRHQHEGRAEGVPQLGLVAALDHGGPVRDLQVDLEADLLQLALA